MSDGNQAQRRSEMYFSTRIMCQGVRQKAYLIVKAVDVVVNIMVVVKAVDVVVNMMVIVKPVDVVVNMMVAVKAVDVAVNMMVVVKVEVLPIPIAFQLDCSEGKKNISFKPLNNGTISRYS